ncbi:hypothetical protein ACLNGM_01435 [Aureimonas phyllosphaerae]|uniref:hypothetical protein n=1 Tax=Aureimonas phyllosphaerae TaxID=1166078 RepID=UPI003A5C48E0
MPVASAGARRWKEGGTGARIFAAILAAASAEPPTSETVDDNEFTPRQVGAVM